MATTIAEPNDLPAGSITPENENNFNILVYQRQQDNAGIKKLALGDWKTYLGYNSNMVKNVADFIGIDSDYPWDSDEIVHYTGTKIATRIQAVADQAGVTTVPSTGSSLKSRIEDLEGYVKDGWDDSGTHVNGLLARATALENRATNIEDTIGDTTSLAGATLMTKIAANETAITGLSDTIGNTSSLTGTVMDEITQIESDVTDINDTIGADDTSGLRLRIKTNEDDIADIKAEIGDVTTIPAGSSIMGEINTNKTDIAALKQTVSSAYVVQGNVIDASAGGITLSDLSTKTWAELENGWVYNVDPTGGADTLTIKNKTYAKGANIAWVESLENFDELGTTIDVQRITDLETEVTALSGKVDVLEGKFVVTDSTWSSTGLTGFYLINITNPRPTTGTTTASCLFYFSNGIKVTSVDLTNNYADFFVDSLNDVTINDISVLSTASVYQVKLC